MPFRSDKFTETGYSCKNSFRDNQARLETSFSRNDNFICIFSEKMILSVDKFVIFVKTESEKAKEIQSNLKFF